MAISKHILITGSTGFVGKALTSVLEKKGFHLRSLVRNIGQVSDADRIFTYDSLDSEDGRKRLFEGVTCIVHLAGRAHVMEEVDDNALNKYRDTNVVLTRKLLEAIPSSSPIQFIYLSTAKVYGEVNKKTSSGATLLFREQDAAAQPDPYSLSKYEAELLISNFSRGDFFKFTIVRPPLIYGPGVRANFLSLIGLVDRRFPLPLKSFKEKRSFVGLRNLLDLLVLCIDNPQAYNQAFSVRDSEMMDIGELIFLIARSLGKTAWIFHFPRVVIVACARLLGRQSTLSKLICPFQIDLQKTFEVLGWYPPYSTSDELEETIGWYRSNK